MRVKKSDGVLTVNVVAGTYVVLLGIDMTEEGCKGLLGFAIKRKDHTENTQYWLKGFKVFESTEPKPGSGENVSCLQCPIQTFKWCDETAKPNHNYTYTVVAMKGKPEKLEQCERVEVNITTENENTGTHAVYFNRGVAGSQAYVRRFNNRPPEKVGEEAWKWLSRGLKEAMISFIGQAKGKDYAIRVAFYEFVYPDVLKAFKDAAGSGADVKIIVDARDNKKSNRSEPRDENLKAIKDAGLDESIIILRQADRNYIAHNKFIVLLENGVPIQVWTGSTNATTNGIFGQSNVGHVVRDKKIADIYNTYWTELSSDPWADDSTAHKNRGLRNFNEKLTPVPNELPLQDSIGVIFSPRNSLQALNWYVGLMEESKSPVFITPAFGLNEYFTKVLAENKDYLRYILFDKPDTKDMKAITQCKYNRVAWGSTLENTFENWLEERTLNIGLHVKYIHTKYMLINPLGDDPIVISGSANFSEASTLRNDENMLVIRGNTQVADIYLGEFIRLFEHFKFRNYVNRYNAVRSTPEYLDSTDGWTKVYFEEGSVKQKERIYFSGNGQ